MSDDKKMIQASEEAYTSYKSYKRVDFNALCEGAQGDYGHGNFISHQGLTFMDVVGRLYLTGNDLLYYPELAVKLRDIQEYPMLERVYPVNPDIKGMGFIKYFYRHVLESFKAFDADLAKASQEVNTVLNVYGMKRKVPIIDRVEVENTQKPFGYRKLVINGVDWYLDNAHSARRSTERIDLEQLLNIPREFERVEFEGVAAGTPFLALRLGKTWKHRGRVNWYSLDSATRSCLKKLLC